MANVTITPPSGVNNAVPKFNGATSVINSAIVEVGGNVGIGVPAPSEKLSVNGTVESASGGFKFPDGSLQTSAQNIDLSTRVKSLMNADIPSMCTHYSQAFIMLDGTVKTSGSPRYGNLGSGDYQNVQMRPVPLAFDNQNIGPIDAVVMNFHGGHILTAAGAVWGWGYNNIGQVGDGTYPNTRYNPVPINWKSNIPNPVVVKLASSTRDEYMNYDHSSWYALDDAGNVWSWGYNGHGQLALGDTETRPHPFKTSISGVTDIEATGGPQGAVFAITDNGDVYSAGYNSSGILGYEGGSTNWKKVILPEPCLKVRSTGIYYQDGNGYGHTLYLLESGKVYCSGTNNYGQLGLGTQNSVIGNPTLIGSLNNISDIWVGGGLWGSSFAVDSSGNLFVWGANFNGQLGIGTTGYETSPVLHSVNNVVSVKIGGSGNGNHSLLLTQSGWVYAAGCNSYGQLGNGTSGQPSNAPFTHKLMLLPPNVQGTIVQIGVSGFSSATASQMLDSYGHVWTCGNNVGQHLSANPSFSDRHTMPVRVMF